MVGLARVLAAVVRAAFLLEIFLYQEAPHTPLRLALVVRRLRRAQTASLRLLQPLAADTVVLALILPETVGLAAGFETLLAKVLV